MATVKKQGKDREMDALVRGDKGFYDEMEKRHGRIAREIMRVLNAHKNDGATADEILSGVTAAFGSVAISVAINYGFDVREFVTHVYSKSMETSLESATRIDASDLNPSVN